MYKLLVLLGTVAAVGVLSLCFVGYILYMDEHAPIQPNKSGHIEQTAISGTPTETPFPTWTPITVTPTAWTIPSATPHATWTPTETVEPKILPSRKDVPTLTITPWPTLTATPGF
jgi:hypothetical protein